MGSPNLWRHSFEAVDDRIQDRPGCSPAAVQPIIFPGKDYPANTLLIISGLINEDFLVEIKAVASLP